MKRATRNYVYLSLHRRMVMASTENSNNESSSTQKYCIYAREPGMGKRMSQIENARIKYRLTIELSAAKGPTNIFRAHPLIRNIEQLKMG